VVGDAASLPWDADQFTIVTSNCVGCFEAKALPAIEEMYRVLKPGGRAVLSEDHRTEMEEAMLGMRPDRADNSRLSCQIQVTDALEGLVVRLPEFQM